jgi:hypothetical protein
MPKNWKLYAIRVAVRCVTFYVAIALVQYLFEGKVAWAINLYPAIAFAALLTYMQARWAYIQTLSRKKK